jgi:hypothetical protein
VTVPEQHDAAAQHQQPAPEGDRTLKQRVQGNRRSLQLTALILVLFTINFLWSSHTATTAANGQAAIEAKALAAQQKAISTACDFWYPLTSLPVTIVGGQTRPTELSVRLIAGAREGYNGQCHQPDWPPMPPPAPSLQRWAKFYHLPDPP